MLELRAIEATAIFCYQNWSRHHLSVVIVKVCQIQLMILRQFYCLWITIFSNEAEKFATEFPSHESPKVFRKEIGSSHKAVYDRMGYEPESLLADNEEQRVSRPWGKEDCTHSNDPGFVLIRYNIVWLWVYLLIVIKGRGEKTTCVRFWNPQVGEYLSDFQSLPRRRLYTSTHQKPFPEGKEALLTGPCIGWQKSRIESLPANKERYQVIYLCDAKWNWQNASLLKG